MRHAKPHVQSQPQSDVLNIVRQALRDAATAPTVFDALDIAGDALRRLAELEQQTSGR